MCLLYHYLSDSQLYAESKTDGFTFHEKTPTISATQINPAKDSDLSIELATVENAEACPSLSVG